MTKTTSEQLGIQGLGWIVRRAEQGPASLVSFYQTALGLRQLRPAGPTGSVMLWAGDIVMLELSTLTVGVDSLARRDDFGFLLRAHDYDHTKKVVTQAKATVDREEKSNGRALYARDPAGLIFGLWDAHLGSGFPTDSVADVIWKNGAITLPNTPTLPASLQDIASIHLKVANPAAMAAFYVDTLGLEVLGAPSSKGVTLGLGRTVALDLRPGGVKRQPLKDRNESPEVWILRVYDHDGLAKRLAQKNVTIVNQISITGGKLTYALDPEGHLFGIQQRTPDLLPPTAVERFEDTVARRLWTEVKD